MTPTTLHAVLPAAIWLVTALLCLLLEAAGTPIGARKRGDRTHLPWVIGVAASAVICTAVMGWPTAAVPATSVSGLVFDRLGLLSTSLLALLIVCAHTAAVPALRAIDEERGEMSAAFAVFGAALSLLTVANDVLIVMAALVLGGVATGLLAAPDREGPHGIEAATKGILAVGLILVLFALATVYSWAAEGDSSWSAFGRAWTTSPGLAAFASACSVVAFALLLGAVPLHQTSVDVAHGAAAPSSSLLVAGSFVAGGGALLRFVDGVASGGPPGAVGETWMLLAVVTLVGAPVAALDESRVLRSLAYLALLPTGVLCAAAASAVTEGAVFSTAWRAGLEAVCSGGIAAAAALLGAAIPGLDAASTWEDWSGVGRRRPVMAALLVYALGSLAGIPGTPGFDARLDVAGAAFEAHLDVLGVLVLASAAVGAAPLVRLALFFFAKEPPPRAEPPPRPGAALLVGAFALLVAVAVALAVIPGPLASLLAATRPLAGRG